MHFITVVNSEAEAAQARFMIESLRAFGGQLCDSPVWIFRPDGSVAGDLSILKNVEVIPLEIAAPCQHYELADKVFACARAEELLGSGAGSLAWINLDCLFVNPPVLFELGPSFEAALRPVHLRNVGSPAGEPLDDYWKKVYACTGVNEAGYSVESFVDCQTLRPYYNTHCFSVQAAKGILQVWRECFAALISDPDFQAGPCHDELHRVFLHQVVLSALITKSMERSRIRMLPPEYSYPLHLQQQISPDHRLNLLNSTVCTVYENANLLTGIEVAGPLGSWLKAHH